MKRSRFKSSRLIVLLALMAVLLPSLAVLQYYWLGQVSDGASERLRQSLEAGAMRFRQDFNREFIRAFLNFQMDSAAPPTDASDIAQHHLERLVRWNQTAPYPQLVKGVYLIDYDEAGRRRLQRINAESTQLESTTDSPELEQLRTRFGIRSEPANSKAVTETRFVESFAEDIPALIVPLPTANEAGGEAIRPPGFTVLMLDQEFLQHEFIPSLIQRHLADTSSEYDLVVASLRDPNRVIYSSRSPLPDFSSFDVSTRIFGLEPDELQAFVRSEGTRMSSPVQRGARLMRLNLKYLKGPETSSGTASQKEDGRWQLLIKHQSGSLAAAVSSVRRRNLAIGFGILLLLAGAIVMTAISMRRAERLAEQRINFVAGVTHELRTPLAVICAAGENLADGIVDDPTKVVNYGRVIHKEGRRLAEMVEQVLEFAGAQSGKRRYESQLIVVEDLIADAIASSQTEIERRNFTIETSVASALPLIKGDPAALKRVMQNLINNAMKYNGRNCWAKVSAHAQPDELLIVVEDRGLGIDAVDLPHVFEPFFRGQEAIDAQIEGSGVGLSLVKQIVEAHGGRITVKSTPNIGSTFTVHLPCKAVADETARIAETASHEATHSAH